MSDNPQLSAAGFPARFCVARSAHNTVLSHSVIADVHPNHCYVLQGVDASASFYGVQFDAWISLGSPGNKCVFWTHTYDPLKDGGYCSGSWRGNLPWYLGEILEVGIECQVFADLALTAWGVWMPIPLAVLL